MDGYREFYRFPVSAEHNSSRYPTGYGTLAGEPLHSTYTRSALDAYAGYGAPAAYQPELMPVPLHPQYLSPRRPRSPRRRPPGQNKGKRSLALADSLTPKKKPFKKRVSPRRDMQKQGSDRKPLRREQKNAGKRQESLAATLLAKETEELHKLFRNGVGSERKAVKPIAKQAHGSHAKKDVDLSAKKNVASNAGQKRKADEQKREGAPPLKKKNRGKKKKFAKEKKQDVKKVEKPVRAPKVVKVEPAALTEEEKKELALSLELQKTACKGVAEFLGIPEKSTEAEAEVKAEAEAEGEVKAAAEAKGEVKAVAEAEVKAEAEAEAEKSEPKQAPGDGAQEVVSKQLPTLSPEEEKELEEKGFVFFSKMLEENQDLRKLYIEKKDAGTFECLVCHSVDPDTSKKFANLTNLVMHTSMRKQKRAEHRGYGKAICDILGWESLRAPKRPVKQAKDDADNTKQVEAADKIEGKQEGTNDQ